MKPFINPDVKPASPESPPPSRLPGNQEYRNIPKAFRFLLALAIIGVASGLIGAFFTIVLSGVEHLAFGFTTGTFAEAVTQVSPLHRFIAVTVAGLVVAATWYGFRRYGPKIPSPSEIYAGQRVSGFWMAADTTLQVINVAAGGSIGREGAPRQAGALSGAQVAAALKLDLDQCRLLIACGTGAGLAAIYNVPLGGTLFAVEVLIGLHALRKSLGAALKTTLSAFAVSLLATMIARIVVPDTPTYAVEWHTVGARLWLVALLLGPVAGAAGFGFALVMNRVQASAPKGRDILWAMPLCYLLLAGLAVPLPLILGNGHAMAQSLFSQNVPLLTAAILIFAKPAATLLTVRAGATGGQLTPSLATGAAIGILVAGLCSGFWPVPATAVAILGAAAFLSGAMRAPLTAGVLAIEFTGAGPAIWGLATLTIVGSWLTSLGLSRFSSSKKNAESPH